MATDGSRTMLEENDELLSDPEPGGNIPKRHARVTVKYNRKELQRRLDVEKWIDESLDRLYRGQKESFPQRTEIEQTGCSVELQACLCQDPDLTNEEAQSSGVDGWVFCLYNGCLFKQSRPLLQYFANVSILPPEPIDVWSTLTLSGF
ncbi:hypothetical protein AMECASPLE_020173 [Ameca splendens]|uniref:Protein phosphatase 1 regulatory subunit 14A n=1 Tax=Ameca splendens TaxID=208324 RepID=A0ABV0YQY1_9TELE